VVVALVSAANSRALDDDLPPLSAALDALGVETEVVDWDDPNTDWSGFELAIVRSTWDYPDRRDEFLAWAERVETATTLLNPSAVLRWNTDKRYLADLARHGVPVVPTTFYAPGDAVDIAAEDATVVKPAVSAGARDAARYAAGDRDGVRSHVAGLNAAGRVAMVQPYMPGIDEAGESGLVFVDGVLSHGLFKAPILSSAVEMVDGVYALETLAARDPTEAQHTVGTAALTATDAVLGRDAQPPLLYARVDLVPGSEGTPLVLELELTEPSLFHAYAPGSAARFAAAIAARVQNTHS